MSTLAERIDEIVRPQAPAERLAAVRILVGAFAVVYLAVRAVSLASVASFKAADFKPVGPIRLLDGPVAPWLVYAAVGATMLLSIPFLLGYRFRWTGPAFAALLLWTTSYRNSFGMIFHTENLFVLHALVLGLSDAAAATSLDARARPAAADSRRFGFPLALMSLITVAAYVLAGVAKVRISGSAWVAGDALRNHIAHDNLRKALLGDGYSALGAWLVAHPWVFKPFAVLTLAFELGAPLALLSRRVAATICAGLWLFHLGVLAIMWILFPYPIVGIAFASFFPVERVVARVRRLVWRGS
jgi:hypothetical protein